MKYEITTANEIGAGSTIIQAQGTGFCNGSHMWTYSSSAGTIPEGTPCDCGAVRYKLAKYCVTCGHLLENNQ